MIDFFNNRLDSIKGNSAGAPEGQATWNVDRVLELVQTFAQVLLLHQHEAHISVDLTRPRQAVCFGRVHAVIRVPSTTLTLQSMWVLVNDTLRHQHPHCIAESDH